ncbi:hypothetical protein QFZ43_004992 [Streptomyces afghaniensis]|nr:hypothetical protein [Streptomyces afghaniensis]
MTLLGRARARAVETLTLDSPHNRNALSAALVGELADALADAGRDPGVRAVVLTHTGNTFSAGADLKDPPPPGALVALLRRIIELPKPVVARVTGHVRAGGLGLLAACDIAAASTDATFAFTEVRIGVAPAVISLPLLPRADPRAPCPATTSPANASMPPRRPRPACSPPTPTTSTRPWPPSSTACADPPPTPWPRRNGCSRLGCWKPSTGTRPS